MTFSTFSLCPLWVCPLHLSNHCPPAVSEEILRNGKEWSEAQGSWNGGQLQAQKQENHLCVTGAGVLYIGYIIPTGKDTCAFYKIGGSFGPKVGNWVENEFRRPSGPGVRRVKNGVEKNRKKSRKRVEISTFQLFFRYRPKGVPPQRCSPN